MVDRPEGPKPGTPEYDWLYGESGGRPADATRKRPLPRTEKPRAQAQEPEATRILPRLPRPTSGAASPPPPPKRPVAPPPAPGRPRGRMSPFRWAMLLLLVWVLFLVMVPFYALGKVSTVEAMPDGERPEDQDGTTYLVVGSDSADDLTEEQRKQIRAGDRSGGRTDSIMLLHVGSGPDLLMSIPRDSIVEVPGRDGTFKINGVTNPDAFDGGGPSLLVSTVELNTGIHVDHYVEIGFGGFVDVVDAVGGIEICPETDMKDKDARLDIKKGCQEADGVTALGYARSRKTDKQFGDVGRAKHQREVVSAVGSEAVSPWTAINPFRYWNLNMAAAETLTVSDGTGPYALAKFALAMTRVDGDSGLTCGVPIRDLGVNWDAERSEKLFGYLVDDNTEDIPDQLCTPTGMPE
jgi:LCP family protein required for cell wall assembly